MANQIFDDETDPAMVARPDPRGCVTVSRDDARALWAVRVLDAYSDAAYCYYEMTQGNGGHYCCLFRPMTSGRGAEEFDNHWGKTRDAARLAAARAVYPTLDAATRERLGECP